MIVFCKICNKRFYPRPSHVKMGWGIYCSINCKKIGTRIRQKVFCFICNKELYRTITQMKHSKSGKYFCNKSCQTKWRNTEYIGTKHKGYKDGNSVYQSILNRLKIPKMCSFCGEKDIRVLVTHHADENHKNNNVNNLAWLCRNCHVLVHYAKVEKQKFLIKHNKRLSK